jgi:hypothetical protein
MARGLVGWFQGSADLASPYIRVYRCPPVESQEQVLLRMFDRNQTLY